MLKFLTSFFVLLIASASLALPPPVRAAVPVGLPPPLVFEKEVELTGIVPEYTRALLGILGQTGSLSLLPRNRINKYLHEGQVDFLCYTSELWSDDRNTYNWTDTLFRKKEIILGPLPMPKDLKGLHGKILGTILGYRYPRLEPMIKEKQLHREDGPSEEANLIKFRDNHIDYLVVDEIFLDYYKKKNPEIDKGRGRLVLEEYPVSCAVSKKGRVSVSELNKAITKLKSSGKLQETFKKYGVSVLE